MINPFKKTYTEREYNIFVFLANMRLFSELNYKQMAHFIPHLHERTYEKDEVVFFRNDPSHALYLLRKGEVSLNIDINDTFEHLTEVKAGNSLGESCLLKKAKRQLNAVVSSEKAEFYVIPQENIRSIFEDNLKIKSKMLEALAEIYNEYNSSLFSEYRAASGFFNLQLVYRKD
ncbi:Crp/Fnr family transcriptional regulator [Fulvivirga lutea]|uniref:Cyclic nucleotide-binding domain-containing protein n=1 Tax=Fulvivirga lutea TaxID=2810512 RepID=A0A974WI27_9BACT|nr:cyclic nucleotide-binding domain-containing protein [Fulvivirga lutea]QSE98953.1 cyclic nucleotide-binding domain-containing protein [Fulvivirga lutea]